MMRTMTQSAETRVGSLPSDCKCFHRMRCLKQSESDLSFILNTKRLFVIPFLTKHEAMRVAAQTTRDGIRQYSHCEYVHSRSLPHCKNYSFGHVGLRSSLFSITVQELPQKNVYDHIERRFLHMRTIFTDNIRYSLMCCTKALMCVVIIFGHIDKFFQKAGSLFRSPVLPSSLGSMV